MRNFFERKTGLFLIIATVVIAIIIGIFAATSAGRKASVAENVAGTITEPGQIAATETGGLLHRLASYFGNVKALRKENEELKLANIELDKKIRDFQSTEKENYELRAMLDLVETESKLDLEAVKVIAKDPSNWYSSFTINKGTSDGIEKNQPVITANRELIGRVYKVGNNWAEVITVLDPESGVGSMIERTKDIGVIEGDFSLLMKGLCRLGYLGKDAEVSVGDYVETSGMGGIYPKGLLIGKVTEVYEDTATMSQYANVEPIVNFGRLNEIFVLKNFVDEIKRPPVDDINNIDNSDKKESDKEETKKEEVKPAESTKTQEPAKKATEKPASTPKNNSETSGNSSNAGTNKPKTENNTSSATKKPTAPLDGTELRD